MRSIILSIALLGCSGSTPSATVIKDDIVQCTLEQAAKISTVLAGEPKTDAVKQLAGQWAMELGLCIYRRVTSHNDAGVQ